MNISADVPSVNTADPQLTKAAPPRDKDKATKRIIISTIAAIVLGIFGVIGTFFAAAILGSASLSLGLTLLISVIGGAAVATGTYFACNEVVKKTFDKPHSPSAPNAPKQKPYILQEIERSYSATNQEVNRIRSKGEKKAQETLDNTCSDFIKKLAKSEELLKKVKDDPTSTPEKISFFQKACESERSSLNKSLKMLINLQSGFGYNPVIRPEFSALLGV